jgi:hypothetical protein
MSTRNLTNSSYLINVAKIWFRGVSPLHGCEPSPLALWEENRLKAFENKELRATGLVEVK